jgi:hypothetical protein
MGDECSTHTTKKKRNRGRRKRNVRKKGKKKEAKGGISSTIERYRWFWTSRTTTV